MQQQKYLIVIGGPTASGKTNMAIKVAQHFNTTILSADSRQFYREMSIGTAKPTPKELGQVEHHFVDSLSIHEDYSVGDFEREAIELLDNLFKKNDFVVMAGGSGLFVKAVCEGLDQFPDVPNEVKEKWNRLYEQNGIEFLKEKLATVDPEYFKEVDQENPRRLMRAITVHEASGTPFSVFRNQPKPKRVFKPIYLFLKKERTQLYQDINLRVDQMIKEGLEKEVTALKPHLHLNALQTIGYREFIPYFENEVDLDQVIDKIKQHTRNYAKRQMTWYRGQENWKEVDSGDFESALMIVQTFFHH